MKLFTKYNRINLVTTMIIFILASIAFYFFIRFTLIAQVDDDLAIEYNEINSYVGKHKNLPEIIKVVDQNILYIPIEKPYLDVEYRVFNGYDSVENVKDKFRELVFGVTVDGKNYQVTVAKSLESTDDLLQSILLITLTTILCMLIATYLINRIVLKRLWKPFYDALVKIKFFSLSKPGAVTFEPTNTDEFSLMNNTFKTVTDHAWKDYLSLKEFTENASHEMQTPLSIMRSKLDLLIQDEHLSENQSKIIEDVHQSIDKLSRLNNSLLLLAKIGNRQFAAISDVDLTLLVQEKVNSFQELWLSGNISVANNLQSVTVKMNQQLAEILLNNLLSNATKHNYEGGHISINLSPGQLEVSNTSREPQLNDERVFTRFYTPKAELGDHGLGLSIIKQIADTSGMNIKYSFDNGMHFFTLYW